MYFIFKNQDISKCKPGVNIAHNDTFTVRTSINIMRFLNYPDIHGYIIPIIVPTDAIIVRNKYCDTLSINKIIAPNHKYNIYDLKTIIKFNINQYCSINYIEYLCWFGKVDILEWFRKKGLICGSTFMSLLNASERGHVDVLEWWKNTGFILDYNGMCMYMASSKKKLMF
jgi:hypothetical protein